MNSDLHFRGLTGAIVCGLILLNASCATHKGQVPSSTDSMEVSLKEDRSELKELRQEIPMQKRIENDELAFILKILNDNPNDRPEKIRRKYDRAHSRARDKFRKQMNKKRSAYSKNERKKRDQFLAKQRKLRDQFNSTKHGREERKTFYDDQDAKRKEYFANERDARKEFESSQREKSNDFNGKMRETRRQFYDLYKSYSKKYYERKTLERKQKALQKQKGTTYNQKSPGSSPSAGANKVLKEFMEMDNVPAQTLKTDDN